MMLRNFLSTLPSLWMAFSFLFFTSSSYAQTLEWVRQLGTSVRDESNGVSADGFGNVYISGRTGGSLGGPNAGRTDAFIGKYDSSGTLEWTRQFGTVMTDWSTGVSVDGLGNVYISGGTIGDLDEANTVFSEPFIYDAFVGKYDANGTLEWIQQFRTSSNDWSTGVSADGLGNVYISGYTESSLEGSPNRDAFVSKYSTDVPEPTTELLLILGMAVLFFYRHSVASISPHSRPSKRT